MLRLAPWLSVLSCTAVLPAVLQMILWVVVLDGSGVQCTHPCPEGLAIWGRGDLCMAQGEQNTLPSWHRQSRHVRPLFVSFRASL